MTDRHSNIADIRMLVVGASVGIGEALALAAHWRKGGPRGATANPTVVCDIVHP